MTVTPKQVKAARRLLGWSQSDLAGYVSVSANTIDDFERHGFAARALDLSKVLTVLEAEGVEFIAKSGGEAAVRLRKSAK